MHDPIRLNFKLSPNFMVFLVTCKNEEDPVKNEGARVFTTLYINFSDAQGQITLESVVVSRQNLNSFKLSCMSSSPVKIKMIQAKMKALEWSQHFSLYKSMEIFPGAQGQLPARIKDIRSKMKALEWSQDFPHYNPMGAICCHGNQSSNPIWPKT